MNSKELQSAIRERFQELQEKFSPDSIPSVIQEAISFTCFKALIGANGTIEDFWDIMETLNGIPLPVSSSGLKAMMEGYTGWPLHHRFLQSSSICILKSVPYPFDREKISSQMIEQTMRGYGRLPDGSRVLPFCTN